MSVVGGDLDIVWEGFYLRWFGDVVEGGRGGGVLDSGDRGFFVGLSGLGGGGKEEGRFVVHGG